MAIILDTNLLVLFVVGLSSEKYIKSHKKLGAYTIDDYALLVRILSNSNNVLVTPNTLSEASNLIGYIGEPARSQIYDVFRRFINSPEAKETYVESKSATSHIDFIRLGLADSALLEMSNQTDVLLTADLDLYIAAVSRGLKAENFNHYRNL